MNRRKITAAVSIILIILLLSCVAHLYLQHMYEQESAVLHEPQDPQSLHGKESPDALGSRSSLPHSVARARPSGSTQSAVRSSTPPIRAASIAGCVLDEDGTGIPGATVQLSVQPSKPEESEGTYSATTGNDGIYSIPEIEHFGTVILRASAPGFATIQSGEFMEYFGAPLIPLLMEGVQYKSVDFTLHRAVAQIRGRVVTLSRAGVAKARVVVAKQVCDYGTQEAYWAYSRTDGSFEVDLPCDDPCVLVVYKTGFAPAYLADVLPGPETIEIILRDGGAIIGSVRDSNGASIAGLKIVITPEGTGPDGNPWDAPNSVTVVSREDGSYESRDLSQEFTYTVQAPYPLEKRPQSPAGGHTISDFIRSKEQIAYDFNRMQLGLAEDTPSLMAEVTNVVVRSGQETRVDLTIDDKNRLPAMIYGRISDEATGQPASPFFVFAVAPEVAEAPEFGRIVSADITQEDGSYRMLCYGLTGSTEISVRINYCSHDSFGNEDAQNATVMRDIVIAPGGQEEVNFSVSALVTAPVRVVSSSGEPIQGANVSNVVSDAEGRLTVYGLPPYESNQLRAMWDAQSLHSFLLLGVSEPFSGKPGETVPEVTITCPAPGSLVGHVTLPNGMTEIPTRDRMLCRLHYPDLGTVSLAAFLSIDGTLSVPIAPPGSCTAEFVTLAQNEVDYILAVIDDVVVASGQETNVGTIALEQAQPSYQP